MSEALEPIKDFLHRVRTAVSRHKDDNGGSGLRIVKDPQHAEIDIVAVHGLGGEGFHSWITFDPSAGKSRSWLEELLAKDIPNARIMTYGYISDGVNYRYLVRNVLYGRALDLVKTLGVQRQKDRTSRRPVFFIAHSLGGWIVKRALIISSEASDSVLRDVELSACGVAFFGTLAPGKPLSPTPLAQVIRRTTSGFDQEKWRRRSSESYMQPQAADIEWLETQMEAFKAITSNLPRLSFHETKQSDDGFVVEKRHSMAGSDGTQIGLKATHSGLIKFQGRDANYKAFINNFREMVDKARSAGLLESKRKVFDMAAVHHLEYLSAGFSIPYKLPGEQSSIVPRQGLVERLESILAPSDDPELVHLRIASVYGDPGIGKTTLARYYADAHKDDISFVFWIWAESEETVVTSYLEFANSLVSHYAKDVDRSRVENDLGLAGVDQMLKVKSIHELDKLRIRSVVRSVIDWLLRPGNDKWLLIFDNLESSYNIYDFMPLTLSGRIILTSRDGNCCSWGTRLLVDVMNEEEAVETFLAMVGSEFSNGSQSAPLIVQRLECHPQRLSLAASTIRQKGLSVDEYSGMLELASPMNIGSMLDQSPLAKTILRISAMLSTTIIPITLFSANTQIREVPSRFAKIFAETSGFEDQIHLDSVFQHLWDTNVIQAPSSDDSPPSSQSSFSSSFDYFVLDPDARSHVRSSLTPDEQTENAWLTCNVCVDGIRQNEVYSTSLPEIHDFSRVMAPHAKVCYDEWSKVLTQNDNVAWHVLGNVCMTQGATEQAIGCFKISLASQGLSPIERIQISLSLATLLKQAGNHDGATAILNSISMASIDKALRFQVAMARASVAEDEQDYSRAEDHYETLEHEQEELLGPTDASTVNTVQKLAQTLEHLGKLEEAQALYRRVYISHQNTFGQGHPMTLDALEDLARISKESGAFDEAETLYKQAVDIRTKTLGERHPSTAEAIQHLANLDDDRGHFDEARVKYQRVLDLMVPTLGRAHPLCITTLENMALSARLHGHALTDEDSSNLSAMSEPDPPPTIQTGPAGSVTLDPTNGSGGVAARRSSRGVPAPVLLKSTRRRRAFEQAEELYLDVVRIKRSAKELWRPEEVLESGGKLREMYENEEFFAADRGRKVAELVDILNGRSSNGSPTTVRESQGMDGMDVDVDV